MGVEAVNNDSTHTSQIRSSGLKEDKGSIFESQKGEAENPNEKHYIFKIEPKDKVNCKAQISNIDWCVDARLICASFKGVNVALLVTRPIFASIPIRPSLPTTEVLPEREYATPVKLSSPVTAVRTPLLFQEKVP